MKTVLVMAGGTGGHTFGSGVTLTAFALACTEDMPTFLCIGGGGQ